MTSKLKDCIRYPHLGDQNILKSTHTNVANKMDFNLFIKSFELLSMKVYPKKGLDEAFNTFIEIVR